MKIACIGGGPAGLYLGVLIKRVAPEHEVHVYERNRPGETFGFGVVFSDATLGHLAAADPESHAQITAQFARWDDIAIHVGGEVLRSTGHGFCGIERKALLQILQARAAELGVKISYEHDITSLAQVADADVVVACDGVASWVRDALAAELAPQVDVRPNKFVWLGSTKPLDAFTFLFEPTPHGLYRVHAYPYRADASTFIVECTAETWRAAGFAAAPTDEDHTVAILERVFAAHLGGHRLVKNRSIWRNFPTVRCGKWHAGNVVLVGDAAHTAHFSIGSGTKLAMEDMIVLRDELLATRDVPAALAAYEARRRPEVLALQAAAQASLEWFEGTERYMSMKPAQLAYSLMTRSQRVSHASMVKRDAPLAGAVEVLLARAAGVTTTPPPAPSDLPIAIGDRSARSRRCTTLHEGQTLGEAAPEAGLLVTPPLDGPALASAACKLAVDYVHSVGALVAARIDVTATAGPVGENVATAARAGFDLVLLDPGTDATAIEQLPASVQQARAAWRPAGWIAAAVEDRPGARAAVVGHAAQLVRAGANLLWVASAGDAMMAGARLSAAPLADQLRNELGVATAIVAGDAARADLDAAIAAGRADLVVVGGAA